MGVKAVSYMQDITGHVHELCKDQFGSRFIQMKIETADRGDVRLHSLSMI